MPCADRLREERMQRGWSQTRVAELVGTDPGNVSRWERGRSSPSPYFRERLCQLYQKNAQELGLWIEEPAERKEETPRDDPGKLTVWVGEPMSFDMLEERQAKAAPLVTARVFACLSYVLGWLTGLLMVLFHRSNRFILFHSLQSVCFFGGIHLIVVLCTVPASRSCQERRECARCARDRITSSVGDAAAAEGNKLISIRWCRTSCMQARKEPMPKMPGWSPTFQEGFSSLVSFDVLPRSRREDENGWALPEQADFNLLHTR